MIVTRFAPSPTGLIHLGTAYSALCVAEAARGGRLLLRIEDIDQGRCKPEYEQAMLEDLAWLGLEWEQPVRRQSEHMAEYAWALERLRKRSVLYRCFRTRKEVMEDIVRAPHGAGEAFFGAALPPDEEAERLARGDAFAWRLSLALCRDVLGREMDELIFIDVDRGEVRADPAPLGDVVLARKDFGASYHLAACHDDALQGVNLVVRGEDLLEAAHLHRLLQALLNWPTPTYKHHGLILGEDGKRLAKRDKAATLRSMRESGTSAADIRKRLGF